MTKPKYLYAWYLQKSLGDINTLGKESDYQELMMRIEVELQELQDALINQNLEDAMRRLATMDNVKDLMVEKILEEAAPSLPPPPGEVAPLIECPYCLVEMQTVEDKKRGWVLPDHGMGAPDEPFVECPNSGKGPSEFLIKE